MIFSQLTGLPDSDLERLRTLTREYCTAWSHVPLARLGGVLRKQLPSMEDPIRPLALQSLIAVDLEKRWEQGDRQLLERYVVLIPELVSCDQLAPELVRAEYYARRKSGELPELASYRQRFPRQYVQLKASADWPSEEEGTLQLPRRGDTSSASGVEPEDMSSAPTVAGPRRKSREPPDAASAASAASRGAQPAGSGASRAPSAGQQPPDSAQLPTSRRDSFTPISGYSIKGRIGRGGFGEVWRGEAPGGVEVALKLIPWQGDDDKLSRYELRALELMKRLRHPYLIQNQAYWREQDLLVIVMELADGSLTDRRRECRDEGLPGLPVEELLRYTREAAEALDYLHSQQILHRDVKPANILLVRDHAKLGDFGIARLAGAEKKWVTATFVGSYQYMAPEVWGNKAGPASDQYSLAATYAELRLDQAPFAATSVMDAMRKHTQGNPDLGSLPEPEQAVLRKALAKDASQRFDSCLEFAAALEQAVRQSLDAAASTIPPPARFSRRAALAAGVALSATAALGLAAWWRNRRDSPPGLQLTVVPQHVRLAAGNSYPLTVIVAGTGGQPSEVTLETPLADGIELTHLDQLETPPGDGRREQHATLLVDLNAEPASYQLQLAATSGPQTVRQTVQLDVLAPEVVAVDGFRPYNQGQRPRLIAADGRVYYERIVPEVAGDLEPDCVFRCVPRREVTDPPTFYIMELPVWNGLYERFGESQPDQASPTWQRAADDERLPVVDVTAPEARQFARWIGGDPADLPRWEQWWKAAGYYDYRDTQQGPYNLDQGPVTIETTAPSPVGSAAGDVSPFGIRDMAGNVREWAFPRDWESDPISYAVCGSGFDQSVPTSYASYSEPPSALISGDHRDDIGFRVVINLFPSART